MQGQKAIAPFWLCMAVNLLMTGTMGVNYKTNKKIIHLLTLYNTALQGQKELSAFL